MNIEDRCKRIELVLSDVDGVLTDGGIYFNNQGIETKKFHIRDGLGIKLWQRAGFKFGVLSARTSHIVKVRAAELNVEVVRQGFENKLPVGKKVIAELGLKPDQVCHIGDDLTDLSLLQYVGLSVAVADAAPEVRAAAHYVTTAPGGHGAVREVVELLLKAKHRWEDLVRNYVL